jgi:hypothetical protein
MLLLLVLPVAIHPAIKNIWDTLSVHTVTFRLLPSVAFGLYLTKVHNRY